MININMFYLKHRLVIWWITLLILLAGSILPSVHGHQIDSSNGQTITLELCAPSGEMTSYTFSLDSSDSHPHHHDIAHCLFCMLPGSIDAFTINTPIEFQRDGYPIRVAILFPPQLYVLGELEYWHPHHALDPPILT